MGRNGLGKNCRGTPDPGEYSMGSVIKLLSIIIPAFNEEKYLPKTLAALARASKVLRSELGTETEVIVVDNESKDRTAEVAGSAGARVITFSVHNIAAVCNAGVRGSLGEVVVKVDADSQVSERALVEIVTVMNSGKSVGGGVRIFFDTDRRWVKVGARVIEFLLRLKGISVGMIFTRRETFDAVGGFPEDLLAAEDGEFATRLRNYGRAHGLRFSHLTSASILTADRKRSWSFTQQLRLYAEVVFRPKTVRDREKLGYWYDGER